MKYSLSAAISAATMILASGGNTIAQEADTEVFGGLEEIIVTAQRRQESLQDAAIAIDALTTDSITKAGIESAAELGKISPSLGIASSGGPLSSLFIRGVGTNTTNPLFDAGVSQNYDGVYLARPSFVTGVGLYDLERVELLKGPQGTLYGRNATGGVINYIPKKPILGETSGFGQLDLGNFDKVGAQGAVNFSPSDTVAVRIAGSYLDREGYADDGTNDADSKGLRTQILFEPTESLSLRFAIDYSDVGGKGANGDLIGTYDQTTNFTPSGLPIDSGATADGANTIRTATLAAPSFAFYKAIDSDELFLDTTYTGYLFELNYETDVGTLTVIPAFREAEEDYTFVGPAFGPAPSTTDQEQFTLEARFATDLDGPFNSVFGAFYFDEEVDFGANFNQDFVSPIQNFETGGDSWAIFAQGTLDLSESFRLNAGIRYTEDEKFVDGTTHTLLLFCGGPGPGLITPPASFAEGCQNQASLPAIADPDEYINALISSGMIPEGSTISDGFWPVINGIPGAIVDVEGPGGSDISSDLSDDEVTYRFGIEWDFAADSMLYVTYEKGYRAGGVDISRDTPFYPAEFIDAYTIGTKNRLFDNRLQLNAEAFYWEYTDQQINYFAIANGAPDFPTSNGESTIQGVDLDLIWAASEDTIVGLKMQYLDATLDEISFVSDAGTGRYNCTAAAELNSDGRQEYDCSGNTLVYSPEFAIDLNLDHTINLDNYKLSGYASISYRDEQNTDNSFLEETIAEAHTLVGLGLTFAPQDDSWSVTAYGNNVTDERYLVSTSISASGLSHGIYNSPPTYGVRLKAEF